jgi:hypothetical protein
LIDDFLIPSCPYIFQKIQRVTFVLRAYDIDQALVPRSNNTAVLAPRHRKLSKLLYCAVLCQSELPIFAIATCSNIRLLLKNPHGNLTWEQAAQLFLFLPQSTILHWLTQQDAPLSPHSRCFRPLNARNSDGYTAKPSRSFTKTSSSFTRRQSPHSFEP